MAIITITGENIETEHICCAIGNDKENKARAHTKKEWLKKQFDKGLVFKRLDERGKVFIEYMPIENVWKPIVGKNYMVINCLWVSGRYKGKGYSKALLHECIKDAKRLKMDGVAVVTSSKVKPFLTDKGFYVKNGFAVVDTAVPYFELLALAFNGNSSAPVFSKRAKKAECESKDGFTFIYSNQCVFMEEYVSLLSRAAKGAGFPCTLKKLETCADAQKYGSPFGSLGIYYKGDFITHELMTEDKFKKLMKEKCG